MKNAPGQEANHNYSAEHIQLRKTAAEIVRPQPSWFIGNTQDSETLEGLHQMIYEVIDNSVDEYLAGYGESIYVTLTKDGYAIIEDNGRGVPTEMHTEGVSAMEIVFTRLHAGGKFEKQIYKYSSGTHGVGVVVCQVLSSRFDAYSYRNGYIHHMAFEEGTMVQGMEILGKTDKTGTKIIFKPDPKIFANTNFSYDILSRRFEELSMLNPNLTIVLSDERENRIENFLYPQGMKDFLNKIIKNNNSTAVTDVLYINELYSSEEGETPVECVFTWTNDNGEHIRAFTNTVRQKEEGTHVNGFRAAIGKVVLNYIHNHLKPKTKEEFIVKDVHEGIYAIISIKLSKPNFSSQIKSKLSSQEGYYAVEKTISKFLERWLDSNPKKAFAIYERVKNSAQLRKKLKEVREGAKVERISSPKIHMKLVDCQRNNDLPKELFIAEGRSAAGPVERARDSRFQAVYSIRGKILNVEKASLQSLLQTDEVKYLFSVLGTGMGEAFDIRKLRYDKIVILVDADHDGSHIKCLLLALFMKYARPLVLENHLYIAQPPLYDIEYKGKREYVKDERELNKILVQIFNEKYHSKDVLGNVIDLGEYLDVTHEMIEEMKHKIRYQHVELVSFLCSLDFKCNVEADLLDALPMFKKGNWELLKIDNDSIELQYISFFEKTLYQIPRNSLEYFINKFGGEKIFPIYIYQENKQVEVLTHYIQLHNYIFSCSRKNVVIRRNKGLGEMEDEVLSMKVMDPATRVLLQVNVSDVEETLQFTSNTMGKDVQERKELIRIKAGYIMGEL